VDNFCFSEISHRLTLVSQKHRAHFFNNVQREKPLSNPNKAIVYKTNDFKKKKQHF
jgi:hypothetical protein